MFDYLDDRAVQKILVKVNSLVLARILVRASSTAKEKVFRNMSKTAAAMLQKDIDYMGPVTESQEREAKHDLASIVDELVLNGKIRV